MFYIKNTFKSVKRNEKDIFSFMLGFFDKNVAPHYIKTFKSKVLLDPI